VHLLTELPASELAPLLPTGCASIRSCLFDADENVPGRFLHQEPGSLGNRSCAEPWSAMAHPHCPRAALSASLVLGVKAQRRFVTLYRMTSGRGASPGKQTRERLAGKRFYNLRAIFRAGLGYPIGSALSSRHQGHIELDDMPFLPAACGSAYSDCRLIKTVTLDQYC